jgi:hypothetical protein
MLRTRHACYLVLLVALAAVVAVLPASAHAHHGQILKAGAFTLAIDDTSSTENFTPPPQPPIQPDLIFTVGPDARIAAFYSDGRKLTNLPPGTYSVQVHDLSANHNLHLTGPGIDEKTSVAEIEHPVWQLTFKAGTYRLKCDVHPTITGSFTVSTNAPKCKVPRVIGKGLSKARRSIRAAHCSVGRVRYMRSNRLRGRVVRQSPGAGRTLAVGARVNLVVSRGPG